MRTTVVLFLMLNALCLQAQNEDIPTINAEGGKPSVDWPKIKKEADANTDGPGFFDGDCAQGVGSPAASSSLKAQGTKTYAPGNLNDSDPMTAWVEGKPGYGIGEWFRVTAPTVNTIYNGYQATPLVWKNNSRVKKLKVYMDDELLCYLVLEDKMDEQRFDLPLEVDWNKMHDFKFEIMDIYKGLKYDDVAISHVDFVGCCVAEGTFVGFNTELKVDDLVKGSMVTVVDPENGTVKEATVSKVSSVIHSNLLEIRTKDRALLLTADHQLYIRDFGFTSLSRMKSEMKVSDYSGLTGNIEVMVWDEKNKKLEFARILSVRHASGSLKTYAIRGLSEGHAYLVNGFVTKTY